MSNAIPFIKRLILFLLPLTIILLYTEVQLRKMPNSYSKKKLNLEKQIGNAEVLVLGSSQALHGIDPTYFSLKGINAANISQSLYYDKEILKREIDKAKNLKYLIITVSYFTYFYEIHNSLESWRDLYYQKFWKLIPNAETTIWDAKNYSYIALYTPLKTAKYATSNFNVDLAPTLKTNGYIPLINKKSIKFISDQQGKKRVSLHNSIIKIENFKHTIAYLNEIIEIAKTKNIKVVIVTPPVYKTYYENCNEKLVMANDHLTQSISNYDNIKYFNYLKDKRFDKNDFYDNDHLNLQGAKKFSSIINTEILK